MNKKFGTFVVRWMSVLLVLVCVLQQSAVAGERPFLHGLFTDSMVLQRDVPCPIWGWTAPGAAVTVCIGEEKMSAVADGQGRWQATLAPRPAGGSFTITVSGSKTLTLKNVVFGDVWVCSGQSNMDFGIGGVDQWWNELPGKNIDGIRLYWVQTTSSFAPEATVKGSWSVASNDSLLNKQQPFSSVGFSAIGWLFGRTLHQRLGVPIGVIESALGNTSIQSWSTLASLREDAAYGPKLDSFDYYEQQVTDWAKTSDPAYAQTEGWTAPVFDDGAWAEIGLPELWSKAALPEFSGLVWFRRHVELPADWAGHDLELNLGPIEEQSAVWVNGAFVGGQDGYRRDHIFRVPAARVKAGANVIAVRVSGSRGFMGKPDQLALKKGSGPGETMSMAGPWKFRASTPAAKLVGRKRQYNRIWAVGGLYNGMIAPLAPFAIKGVLWYQGEGNAGQLTYERQLTAMIRDWRAVFGQGDFPFYIVQLAGFGPLPAEPVNFSWAVTREIQAKVARSVPNSGLAVAIDRGEIHNIHPPNKRDVAERLAAVALAKTYGIAIPCEGPTYRSMKIEGGRIRITLDHAEGLKSLGSGPAGFAIAGTDRRFVWAQAFLDGETIVVWAPGVKNPEAVRYAWGDNAVCNLYNKADFPAVPFRTDTW